MMRTVFRLIRQGFIDLSLNPWAQIFTLAAVTLVTFLSGLFLMALTTLNHQLGTARGETAFQVFWAPGSNMPEVLRQWEDLKKLPGFVSMKTYDPGEALAELGQKLGRARKDLGADFPFLAGKSPLPATALISFAPKDGTDTEVERRLNETETWLKNLPGVEKVTATPLRDELGQAWRKVSRYVVWPSVGFLILVLGLVVGNTIRLSLLARAHEVEILRFVGARNWYINLPLVVGGAVQGLFGGAFALLLLKFIHLQIRDVLNFPPLLMEIRFLPPELTAALILVPVFTGMLCGRFAAGGR